MVVEDEPAIRSICHRVLTSEGFEVDVAADRKVAKAMICEGRDTASICSTSGCQFWTVKSSIDG